MRQVTDNADLIFMRDALDLILPKLAKVIHNLAQFALKYKDLLADSLLICLDNVTDGLVIFPAMIASQLEQELPFMATES